MILVAIVAFAVAVYLFILFIVKRDRGHKEPLGPLFGAMGFGFLGVVLAGILNAVIIPREVLDAIGTESTSTIPLSTLLISALGIGVIEETVKAIPLALFLYKKRYFDELTDGIIYFGIVGLTFGVVEDLFYSLEFGGGVGLMRILISPYLHAGFTVLFGIMLIRKKLLKTSWLLPLLGLLAAIFAHGMFDLFAFTGGIVGIIALLATTVGLNVYLFVLFRKAQKIDEQHGKSAIGINKYCRNCGRPNPKRLLYCAYCGKHS